MSVCRSRRLRRLPVLVTCISLVAGSAATATVYDYFINLDGSVSAIYTVPSMERPSYLIPTREPTFSTRLTRTPDLWGASITNISGGVWVSDARHVYSKVSPWNSTESY